MTTQHTPYDAHIAQLEQAHGETADTMPIIAGVAAERRGYLAAKQEDAPLLAAAEAAMKWLAIASQNGDRYTNGKHQQHADALSAAITAIKRTKETRDERATGLRNLHR
jgi:hypothetical protein